MNSTAQSPLQITLNGQAHPLAQAATVTDLIAQLQLDARKVAIERNLEIVPRSAYAATPIRDGDAVEIVSFIGGG
jgi:thiamine biosynthesis protein ThiS